MECVQPVAAGARDLRLELGIPPDVVDVDRDTERGRARVVDAARSAARRVECIAQVERLFRRLKGFRRIFSRFDKLDAVFLGFLSFARIAEGLRLC